MNAHIALMKSHTSEAKHRHHKRGYSGVTLRATKVLQRFFLTRVRAALMKRRALLLRLDEISRQKQAELARILEEKERRKNELLLSMDMHARRELAVEIKHSEEVLLEKRILIQALTTDLKAMKKENAFLQKRCKALQRKKIQLKLERKQRSQLAKTTTRDSKRIQDCKVILSHYQVLVSDEQSRLEAVEKRLQHCKYRNRELRQRMGRMVQMVEEREPEHADKWDIIDLLYQMQRDLQKERRSSDVPIVSWGRCHSTASISRDKETVLSAYFMGS